MLIQLPSSLTASVTIIHFFQPLTWVLKGLRRKSWSRNCSYRFPFENHQEQYPVQPRKIWRTLAESIEGDLMVTYIINKKVEDRSSYKEPTNQSMQATRQASLPQEAIRKLLVLWRKSWDNSDYSSANPSCPMLGLYHTINNHDFV